MRAVGIWVIALAGCRTPDATATATATATASATAAATASASASATATATASAAATASALPPDVATEWCIEGMRGLDEDACYLLPPGGVKGGRLLVYLHGIVPPVKDSPQKQAVQGAVIASATRNGAAAIVPRGRKGIGPTGAQDWWAWPTDPVTHERLVKEIVARWVVLKQKLEAIAGARFERTYLAGSSNGAYFLSALALRGDCDALGFPIAGYGAMSGGAAGGRGAGALTGKTPRPFYVGFGTYDAETKSGARNLATVLESAHWPVRVGEHPFGHGARELYLDEAFAFWDSME